MVLFHVFLWCEWKLVDSHKIAAADPAVIQPNDRNNDLSLSVSRVTPTSFGYGWDVTFRTFNSLCKKIKRTWFKVACDFVFYSHISKYKTDSENDNGKRRQDSAAK